MSTHFATGFATDAPLLGLRIYEAAATSPVRFGHRAYQHLLGDGTRGETFVAHGKAMLTANLPSSILRRDKIETALSPKLVYFDGGAVQAPEQAIAKAYA
jgi:hypothetical protein